jgi:hypothetical protein
VRPPPVGFGRLVDATFVAVAVVYGLLLALSDAAGLLGWPLRILVSLSLWRYAYEVLKRVAQGRPTFAPPGMESMNPFGDFSLVLHFGVFGALALLFGEPRLLGDGPGSALLRWGGFAALVIMFPASAALMALTDDIAAALSPRRIAMLMQVLKRAYLPLLGFAVAVLLLTSILHTLPLLLPIRAWLAASAEVWSLLAVFTLIGSAVRGRRDVLDIPGEKEPEEERLSREAREDWRRQLDLAYASIRSGLAAQGYRTIRQLVAGADATVEVQQWVLDEMFKWEDRSHALAFASTFVERLLQMQEQHRALEIAAQCGRYGGGVALDRKTAASLAEYARSLGKHGVADDLIGRAGEIGPRPLTEDRT